MCVLFAIRLFSIFIHCTIFSWECLHNAQSLVLLHVEYNFRFGFYSFACIVLTKRRHNHKNILAQMLNDCNLRLWNASCRTFFTFSLNTVWCTVCNVHMHFLNEPRSSWTLNGSMLDIPSLGLNCLNFKRSCLSEKFNKIRRSIWHFKCKYEPTSNRSSNCTSNIVIKMKTNKLHFLSFGEKISVWSLNQLKIANYSHAWCFFHHFADWVQNVPRSFLVEFFDAG